MADINFVISLGIGSPAAIQEFLTFGLQQGDAPAEDTSVTVPYLIGSTAAQAAQQLASVHLLISITGLTGTVTAQDVAAFTQAARGTTVTITLGGAANNPPRGSRGLADYTLPN